MLLQEPMTT
jgi:hypothetical protein